MSKEQLIQRFAEIRQLVAKEQAAADHLIEENLRSEISLISELSKHIINSGGKRLRPMLVLLTAKAFGYEGHGHIKLAAIIELLHTATLLHDDVVDASQLRRGRETANMIWGDQASVLVGDYLYSRAFQLMVQVDDMAIMGILAQATNRMAAGEVMQLINCHDPDTTEENYMEVIRHKTGTLFSAATQVGTALMKRSSADIQAMADYGTLLGTAFQLIDDVLDYSVSAEEMGKNMGDDLAEGKPTLPFIRALHKASAVERELLRSAIREGQSTNLIAVMAIIKATDAISYTRQVADREAARALSFLNVVPPSPYRDALKDLVEFAVARQH